MNIGNILNRRLGLITVPNLQKVITNLLTTIGFVDDALPDSRPYKVYSALLTQTGTNAPVATVLENTLDGTPVWTRDYIGSYTCALDDAFASGKTSVIISQSITTDIYSNAVFTITDLSADSFGLAVMAGAGSTPEEFEQLDGVMSKSFIEIRVYN